MSETSGKPTSEFEKAAAKHQGESLLSEFWAFLKQNKKWWLLPIVITMLLLVSPLTKLDLNSGSCYASVCPTLGPRRMSHAWS